MDFGKDYYKAYLNNNHMWWGISSLATREVVEEIHMTCKEGWSYINSNYGVGYELVAIFPREER